MLFNICNSFQVEELYINIIIGEWDKASSHGDGELAEYN